MDSNPLSSLDSSQPSRRRRLVKPNSRLHDDMRKTGLAPLELGGSEQNISSTTGPLSLPVSGVTATDISHDKDKCPVRASSKDTAGEYHGSLSHTMLKSARPHLPILPSPNTDSRPILRRFESSWRHEVSVTKHGNDIKLQQDKKVAISRAQEAGVTGSYKSVDSPFGNSLIPVIPLQFLSKTQSMNS